MIQDVTRAHLDRLLVTGQVTVELEGFEEGAKVLDDGAPIETTANPIQQLTTGLPELLQKVDQSLAHLSATLESAHAVLSEENVAHMSNLLANLDEASATLPEVMEKAQTLLTDLDSAVASGREELAVTAASARAALAGFDELRRTATEVTADLQGLLGGERPALHALLLGARDAMREMHALARQIRQAPNSVIYGADERGARGAAQSCGRWR